MRIVTIAILLGLAGGAAARLSQRETPRATDLLRARHLADEIDRRMELPHPKAGGWMPGGDGFGRARPQRGRSRDEGPGELHIQIREPSHQPAPRHAP